MLIYVPLSHIDDNPYQRRSEYGDIEELAGRIAAARESYPETSGLMQVPRGRVTVVDTDTIVDADSVKMFAGENKQWNEDPKTFRIQLAFGHRRLRAFRHLHKSGAPGYEDGRFPIHIDPLTNKQMLDAVWAENYERKDISAVEQAELIRMKLEQLGPDATHATIGEEWGLTRPVITNRLSLLELPESVQAANRDGRVSERLALALKPVLRIGELTKDSQVEWGKKVGEQWGNPASPAAYVEYVIANPDKVSSDDVREFAKRLTRHAGHTLPSWLPKEKIDGSGIEQPQCKGCPFRIDQSCLKPSCVKAKLKVWPDLALAAFSQESGIPTSDREADFKPFSGNSTARDRLKALYDAGETGGGMVCGWVLDDNAVRPYGSGSYIWNVASNEDGRCGIALGYRSNLPDAPNSLEPAGPVYEMPDIDLIEKWILEAATIPRAAKKALIAATSEALAYQVAEFDVIQALMADPEYDWIEDVGKLSKVLANFLFEKGQGVGYAYEKHSTVQGYQAVIDRAGLEINLLGNPTEAAHKTAVLILDYWYENHTRSWRWEGVGREVLSVIATWEQLPGAAASPMAEHVARAQRHITQKIATEGTSPDLSDYQFWTEVYSDRWTCPGCGEDAVIWRGVRADCTECGNEMVESNNKLWAKMVAEDTAADNDTAVCADCGDLMMPDDVITCSCGAALCENCYVEENHVFHDENRDPVFDDLVASFPELVEAEAETAEPAEPLTMTELATEWLRSYQDADGRTWSDLTAGQTHHANSPCYQAFVAAFPAEPEPKWYLKQARAQLERETVVVQEVES